MMILLGAVAALVSLPAARAGITVTVNGPGGSARQVLPDEGGGFDLNMPLNRNSVNHLSVTAEDRYGNSASRALTITQLSLDAIVVSRVTSERLSVEQVEQLVNDGVIDLKNPENYNVSEFKIVLTIGREQVPISIPIPIPIEEDEPQGYEVYKMPKGDDGNSGMPKEEPEIIIFEKPVASPPGMPAPPPIPGVIIIEGRIKSLKEFFSVRLLLMNVSGIFTLQDVTASLEFPDGGLSSTLPADGIVVFGDIEPGSGDEPGQAERQFIIRGDAVGVKRVKVNFGGTVGGAGIPEDTPIPFNGGANTSVEVKGPPQFLVQVTHPDAVVANEPYELKVGITNQGEIPAMYASLDLDVGADARLVKPILNETTGEPTYEEIEGPETRPLGHILPGQTVTETFTVMPLSSGPISSCMGISDQNITLQVLVGDIGCLAGHVPAGRSDSDAPSVTVLPFANAFGVGLDSPVTAFFSTLIDEDTITLGDEGSFKVYDESGEIVPGQVRFVEMFESTIAIWQVNDGITNRLGANTEYTVVLTEDIADKQGRALAGGWTSRFMTTGEGISDVTPPEVSLTLDQGLDPNAVLPGQLIRVNAYAVDQGSGVARVEARIRDMADAQATWTLIDQRSVFEGDTPPYIFSIDSGNLAAGHAYQFRATAIDKMGNAQDASLALTLAASAEPPTIELPANPAQPVARGISIDLTPVAVSAGVRTVRFYLDGAATPFKTVSLAPWTTRLGTLDLALGAHQVRAVAEDALGRTGEDTLDFEVESNSAAPTVAIQSPVDGASLTQGQSLTVAFTVEDPLGVTSVRSMIDGQQCASGLSSFGVDTSALDCGAHTVTVEACNTLGNTATATAAFTVAPLPPAPDPPAAPVAGLIAVGAPSGAMATVTGEAGSVAAGVMVEVRNGAVGHAVTVVATAAGAFAAQIEAIPGQTLEVRAINGGGASPAVSFVVPAPPPPPVLLSIEVEPASIVFTLINQTRPLKVTGHYDDGTAADVTASAMFTTSDPTIAAVSGGGLVVAKGRGTAQVTAQYGGFSVPVTVEGQIVLLTAITARPASLEFGFAGEKQSLTVIGLYNDGTTATLASGNQFASGDGQVASVTGSGMVTAVASGSTQITIARAGIAPAIVPVTVDTSADQPPAVQILSPPEGMAVERGQIVSLTARATDAEGGVTQVAMTATGASAANELRQIAPPLKDTTQHFNITIDTAAPIGGTVDLSVTATDTGGNASPAAVRHLTVADLTAPAVAITAPAQQAEYNYGDAVEVTIGATDAVGVSAIDLLTTGGVALSQTRAIDPPTTAASASFTLNIPANYGQPELRLIARARDAAGNVGAAVPVDLVITGSDITPPVTQVNAVTDLGMGSKVLVSYQVSDGLADLDHVELYFRRNGRGTFNRFTDEAGGNPLGEFAPQAGANGTITFDSTRMGGDGDYEFYVAGVDLAGNREPGPRDGLGAMIGDPGATASFATGTAVAVISSDMELIGPDYDDRNVRIDGAAVTLVGLHSFKNLELLNGAVLRHRKTDTSTTHTLRLSAWTLTIDATSRIDAVGRGYLGGRGWHEQGRSEGNVRLGSDGAGGSHGGRGVGYQGRASAPTYGDLTNPTLPGGGGGAWSDYDGGDGGGAISLNLINLVADGEIDADGAVSAGSAAGCGAGGSIRIDTRTVSGIGAITAAGGGANTGTGAGGGRIAIYYLDMENYARTLIGAPGGQGGYEAAASNGTIYLRQQQAGSGELVLEGVSGGTNYTQLDIPEGTQFDSITLQKHALVVIDDPIRINGRLRVTGDSVLTHSQGKTAGLLIEAAIVQVDAGSAIDATGRGYSPGTGFHSWGRTLGGGEGTPDGAGGSHGGWGAGYQERSAGQVFGDPLRPSTIGAGGGAWGDWDGGAGGGRLTIRATQSVVVHGAIRASGAASQGSAAGGGAGGSVLIETSRLSGDGVIQADGGGQGLGTGGGGGRVAIYCDYVDSLHDLAGLRNITAADGTGTYDPNEAGAGTVFIRRSNQSRGDLILDGNRADRTAETSTPLTPIRFGRAAAVTTDSLRLDGLTTVVPDGLVGLRINPDIAQSEDFLILDNTSNRVILASPNEHGVHFGDVATTGAQYAGVWRFDNIHFRRGGNLVLGDLLEVAQTMHLDENSLLTHYESGNPFINWLDFEVDDLQVEAGCRIDAGGRGYLAGRGWHESGRTVGNAYGSTDGAGGSYGGMGARYQNQVPLPPYGSLTNPLDLGSGGGAWGDTDGGDGGGMLLITARTIRNDGVIAVDGQQSAGSAAGGGSGGTINIACDTLLGGGLIRASGAGDGIGTGGGGGRIALLIGNSIALPEENIRAIGGLGQYGERAGQGSVYIRRPGQSLGEMIIDGYGLATPADTAFIPAGYQFDNLTLRGGARVSADSGVTVSGRLLITGNSILTHSHRHEPGLRVEAGELRIDAGSAIDASGRGYRGGRGHNERGRTLGDIAGSSELSGGSYGGIGGGHEWRSAYQAYGDLTEPDELGSGGGAYGDADGGAGGGRITLAVSGRLRVDGAIRANGATTGQSSYAGNGSGGAILIHAGILAGDGQVESNGGTGIGIPGGGGRVAVYYTALDPAHNLGGLRRISAFAGSTQTAPTRQASAGTVFTKAAAQQSGDLHVDANVVDGDGETTGTAVESTPLTLIPFGVTPAVGTDTIRTDGLFTVMPNGLSGLRINPNLAQASTFRIVDNTASVIRVVTPNEQGVKFEDVATTGAEYAGAWRFDNIRTFRGTNLVVGDKLRVDGTFSLADQSKLTHYETGSTSFLSRLELDIEHFSIDVTSRIDVSGRGYIGGRNHQEYGRTVGFAYGSSHLAGGSHGGRGGIYSSGYASRTTYGSLTDPRDLGSGGGAYGDADGGDGGGVVLLKAGTLAIDGAIVTNGAVGVHPYAGGGSGGSVNIAAGSLTGGGFIRANGETAGGACVGGGGGRIAIALGTSLGLPEAHIEATGGIGNHGTPGGEGTIFIRRPGQAHGDLIIDGHASSFEQDNTPLPAGYQFDNITLRNQANLVVDNGLSVAGALRIESGSVLTHSRVNTGGALIEAGTVIIDETSAIDVTGRGYTGGRGHHEAGRTLNNAYGSGAGTGGSHGGLGAMRENNSGPVYGDPKRPEMLGSGGGAWGDADGGDGGGRVTIVADDVTIDGALRANGGLGAYSYAGHGSGGSILVVAGTLRGDGIISANGGRMADGGVGGGGGRVALHADGIDPVHNFGNLRQVTAFSGLGVSDFTAASAGTVYVNRGGQSAGDLLIDNNMVDGDGETTATASRSTPLPPIGIGIAPAITTDSLTVDGTIGLLAGGMKGVRLNPDLTQGESFRIRENTANRIWVESPNEHGVLFADLASTAGLYGGWHEYDNVIFRRGGNLVLGDPMKVSEQMKIADFGMLTHYEATTALEPWLTLDVGHLLIEATGRIDVTGRGYIGGRTHHERGRTLGNAWGSGAGAGGSYGGLGGQYSSGAPNPLYGSQTDPVDLGSGGGAWGDADGGDGGGRVIVNAGRITVNGSIVAKGSASGGDRAGHGSGGTIRLNAGLLDGSGYLRAQGSSGDGAGVGGGGGRIAIRHVDPLLFPLANVRIDGGSSAYGNGQPGSVHIGQQ